MERFQRVRTMMGDEDDQEFERFVKRHEPRLRAALSARYGVERGADATAEALAYAWEHRRRVLAMDNPAGYLYRVGQSRSRRRQVRFLVARPDVADHAVEPALASALAALSSRQRQVVLLHHGDDWSIREIAAVVGLAPSTVQSHLERAMTTLRDRLGADDALDRVPTQKSP